MKIIKKKMIITCAFPYSNGSIHIGHLFEHIQADILVRYNRLIGNKVYFVCSDDAHGTAIMLKSKKENKLPKNIILKIYNEHILDFKNFNIIYDKYYLTHNLENKKLINFFFKKLKHNGFIKKKNYNQLYDKKKKFFLPDRYVIGICPKCYSYDQYGDNCIICGNFYKSTELINPKSVITGIKPIIKNSKHYFLNLILLKKKIYYWIKSGVIKNEILNKILEWYKNGIKSWNISRNKPYFGFKIPKEKNKFFYVWFDAPIGYIGIIKKLCNFNKKLNFDKIWYKNSNFELYHFIGKDIIYFHSLFWPSMLEGVKLRKPTKLFIHGHITINDIKMSKSKYNFINAKSYYKNINSDCLRYYYASKISNSINDINFNINDFLKCINTDIVNKLANLASRSSSFINKYFFNKLSNNFKNSKIYQIFIKESKKISKLYLNMKISSIIRIVIKLVDLANIYINIKKPWLLFKIKKYDNLHKICSMCINLFKILITYLKPIIPNFILNSEKFLNIKLTWNGIKKPMLGHKIKKFKMLFKRIKKKHILK
ncbi:methionine--tRNA ligase [Enterobacterales bacterium endosymbiont of Anomoneura mori]|uniref:methionine--tRNA ligase n=1 Tax=Enterobacterales bacterium endosymbiont of Anomoneura mori TaxID=3132096 RepID=UPI00399C5618